MITRRKFVLAIGAGGFAPFTAFAQQSQRKEYRIGFISPRSRPSSQNSEIDPFLQGMRQLGYFEGKNLVIEWRFADGKYDLLPGFAAELVNLKLDVIVAVASPAIRAAQQATVTIPIVFPVTGDPVGSGFVASLARPGGNITGLSVLTNQVSAKQLELLMTVVPKSSRIAVLGNPGSLTLAATLNEVRGAARGLGVTILSVEARTEEAIDRAFAAMARERATGVIVPADSLAFLQMRQIAEFAMNHRLSSISSYLEYAEVGGLMSYGQNTIENFHRAATYVHKILKGAKPGDLPIEQPTKFELVVNMKTAKVLGVRIPSSILVRATKVIE